MIVVIEANLPRGLREDLEKLLRRNDKLFAKDLENSGGGRRIV